KERVRNSKSVYIKKSVDKQDIASRYVIRTSMNWNKFKNNVEQWAAERGIYEHSTPEAQLLKALSELGELADAVVKNDREALKDAIGDVAVCLVNYARMANL